MTCRSNFRDLRSSEFERSSCSILGAGPSLLLADKDFINSMPCFVVNSAIIYTDWHDGNSINRFWVSNDSLCLRWTYWDKVKTSKCNIVVRDSWCKYSNLLPESAKFFSPRASNINIDSAEDGLCFCSSVPTCIDMAIAFGFKYIYLFGVDHNKENTGYFWSNWEKSMKPKQVVDFSGERKFITEPLALRQPMDERLKVWNENIGCFHALGRHAESHGIRIVNMNKNSAVDAFMYGENGG